VATRLPLAVPVAPVVRQAGAAARPVPVAARRLPAPLRQAAGPLPRSEPVAQATAQALPGPAVRSAPAQPRQAIRARRRGRARAASVRPVFRQPPQLQTAADRPASATAPATCSRQRSPPSRPQWRWSRSVCRPSSASPMRPQKAIHRRQHCGAPAPAPGRWFDLSLGPSGDHTLVHRHNARLTCRRRRCARTNAIPMSCLRDPEGEAAHPEGDI